MKPGPRISGHRVWGPVAGIGQLVGRARVTELVSIGVHMASSWLSSPVLCGGHWPLVGEANS